MSATNRGKKRIWWDRPLALLEALVVTKAYLSEGKKVALPRRQLARARLIMGVHGEGGYWIKSRNWKRRLRLAGLDPETCQVVDEVRFSHAIDFIREYETFRENDFRRWLEMHPEPSSVPPVDVPQRPHPKSRKYKEEQKRSEAAGEYLSRKMRENYGI